MSTEVLAQPMELGLFIDGKFENSLSGKTFKVYNPATGEVIANVQEGDKEDINKAVLSARKAFPAWSETPAAARSIMLNKLADLLEAKKEEFARLESLNTGKPIVESLFVDLGMAIDCFRFYASASRLVRGETIPVPSGHFAYTLKEPIGVVGQIIPWNFPVTMAAWKLGPALAAGCTVVLKPAEQTPITALKLAELINEAGIPAGVVNVVPGFGETAGAALVEHPDVDKIAFTGETKTGKLIMENAAKTLKKVSLELGGKAPNIIFEDANLDMAVKTAAWAIYFNQGQTCVSGSRLYVQESVYDQVMEKLVEFSKKIRMGSPLEMSTQIGAVVSQEQFDKIMSYIEIGKQEGAKVAVGGNRAGGEFSKGLFIEPTVLEATQKMRVVQEEIFGPVLSVVKFKDINEAIELANDVQYGLASAVWTTNLNTANTMAKKIKAGTVWVNTYNFICHEVPFGGYKQSGIGREMGLQAVDLYMETKSIIMDMGANTPNWYGLE
ncbi:MAG: aldehyde dehydrogenase family protein [Candidatus Sericytochromatia bacterium]